MPWCAGCTVCNGAYDLFRKGYSIVPLTMRVAAEFLSEINIKLWRFKGFTLVISEE